MPTSSNATATEKKYTFRLKQNQTKSIDQNETQRSENFLTIEPALPKNEQKRLYKRSHSTLSISSVYNCKTQESLAKLCEPITIQTKSDGTYYISRTTKEKETYPDRISLDRRGLTTVPIIHGDDRLRLLSLQHNLVNNLEGFQSQTFPFLVFLDIYDNQIDHISHLDTLNNLRVLLMGKNRLRKIEGLSGLKKIEVLDLHGNQITHVNGLSNLTELKVLNLAGNQLRTIGISDLHGLHSLQELNIRRNRLRKLLGFGETPNLIKIFISNNDLQSIEDISSLAKSTNLKEISIDNNPISLAGDCVSFLVSYLPQLIKLNTTQITEQVRKAAMAWRRNKETTNTAFMDLTSDVCLNVRREEVISNARTNWELIRSQTKCLTNSNAIGKSLKNFKTDSDFILTSLIKPELTTQKHAKIKLRNFPIISKVPKLIRTNSQDTENSQNTTTTSSNCSSEFFRLPPILVPIINKLEQKGCKRSGSLSSIGPNIDSSVSSLESGDEEDEEEEEEDESTRTSCSKSSDDNAECESFNQVVSSSVEKEKNSNNCVNITLPNELDNKNKISADSASNLSSTGTIPSTNSSTASNQKVEKSEKLPRNVKSAVNTRILNSKLNIRATTAHKNKKLTSPGAAGCTVQVAAVTIAKDREQGGDYLIEICGRYLNVYGQCALRFIDKPWNSVKALDVTTVKFNYINFNGIVGIFNKLKQRFPNIEHFYFKETNINCLGQLNALSEVQGLTSIYIDCDGNSITEKIWESYAIYRLSHWGLKIINDREITDDDIKLANEEYQSLSDLVLWSLPDALLQPLLMRLRLDVHNGFAEQNVKRWLLSADPALKNVVSKEALQWKKAPVAQEDILARQKAKQHISSLLEEMSNAVKKLRLLDDQWPSILHEFVQNTLLDYSQLDIYMKKQIQELNISK